MKYTKQVSRFFVMLILISLAGCIKSGDFDFNKVKDIEWNPKLAIPLVSSDLTIMDLIKQNGNTSDFVIDNQGFVTLVYKARLFTINPSSMYTILTSSFNFSHTFTAIEANAISSIGSLTITFEQFITLTPKVSMRIDSLIYGKGDLKLTITGTVINNNGSITLTIPEARKNGLPLNTTYTPLANGVNTIDLSGYKFNLTKVVGKPSTIRFNASITVTNSPAGSITAGKVINFNFVHRTESIKVLSGYFGQESLIIDKVAQNLNIFNNTFSQGQFSLADPELKFIFTNSIGIPIQLRFSELRGINTNTRQSIDLAGNPGIPNPIDLNSPAYLSNSPVIRTYIINNSTTGGAITNLFKIKPNNISYNFYSLTNPNGAVSLNFLRDTSKLNVDVEVKLPLHGYVKNFAIQDTLDFKIDNIDEIETMLLRTIIDNEFPLEAKMQVFFTDANYVRLDSLVNSTIPADQIIIPAAQVNLTTGQLTSATQKISNFNYPKTRIKKITGSQKIIVRALLSTSGSATQNIKIYNTYKLKVKIATQLEIKQKI